jgi:hypothetical protein
MSASVISNSPAPVDRAVLTFGAFALSSGAPVVVDDRTYDEQLYTTDATAAAAIAAKLSAA